MGEKRRGAKEEMRGSFSRRWTGSSSVYRPWWMASFKSINISIYSSERKRWKEKDWLTEEGGRKEAEQANTDSLHHTGYSRDNGKGRGRNHTYKPRCALALISTCCSCFHLVSSSAPISTTCSGLSLHTRPWLCLWRWCWLRLAAAPHTAPGLHIYQLVISWPFASFTWLDCCHCAFLSVRCVHHAAQ